MNTMIKQGVIDQMKTLIVRSKDYSTELANADGIMKALVIYQGVAELKAMLTDELIGAIKATAGGGLTFKTDKDSKQDKYPVSVYRDCIAEALIRGLSLVGNQFNIIAGGFFCTKEGWDHRLRQIGAKKIDVVVGTPSSITEKPVGSSGTMKVTAYFAGQASCEINGQVMSIARVDHNQIDSRICVTAFGRDIEDCMAGLKGKAEARLLRALYSYVADDADAGGEDVDSDAVKTEVIDTTCEPVAEPVVVDVNAVEVAPEPSPKYLAALKAVGKAQHVRALTQIVDQAMKYAEEKLITAEEYDAIGAACDARKAELS